MTILVLTHRLPYAANRGDRLRVLHMLKFLSGHATLHVISLVHDAEEASHAGDLTGIAASVAVAPVSRARGYPRAVTAAATGGTFTHAFLDGAEMPRLCREAAERYRPDLVLAYCSSMARYALEPPLSNVPLVVDLIDVDSEKWRIMAQSSRLPMRLVYAAEARRLAAFEARLAGRARALLVVNQREKDAMLAIAPHAQVHVVPNGVALDEFSPAHPAAPAVGDGPAAPRVCFCGVMNYGPNEEAALWFARSVWPEIAARRPDAQLSIVGSHPTAAIAGLAADPSIEVTGAVPDVRPYLWRSAVSVAPLFVARGVQNKVVEAVAAGLPCVVSGVVDEGLPEEVRQSCLVARHDPKEFAGAVLALLNRSPRERRQFAAQANLRPLTWNTRLAPLLDLVASVT